jgi:hypothetical protein
MPTHKRQFALIRAFEVVQHLDFSFRRSLSDKGRLHQPVELAQSYAGRHVVALTRRFVLELSFRENIVPLGRWFLIADPAIVSAIGLIVNIVMAVITADFRSTKIAIFPFRTRRTTASTISHVCDLHILHVTCHASSVSAGASWPSWFWPLASNSRNVCQGSQVYNSQNMEASQC